MFSPIMIEQELAQMEGPKMYVSQRGPSKKRPRQGGNPANPKSKKGQKVLKVESHLRFVNRLTEEFMNLGRGARVFLPKKGRRN